jgi:hypothetical protein
MKFPRASAAAIAILCALLSSCINGREEIWLNADGSGRADLFYDVPAAAARFQGGAAGIDKLIGSLIEKLPDHSHEITQQDDRLKVRVKVSFKSPEELTSLTSSVSGRKVPSSLEHLGGIFEVKQDLLDVDFTRTISPAKALPVAFIPRSEFENRKLTYIVHLPVRAVETNADRVENGGRTLTWEQPLAAAIREPIVVHFKAKIPLPAWLIAAVWGVVILIALVIGGVFLKKGRVRGLAAP